MRQGMKEELKGSVYCSEEWDYHFKRMTRSWSGVKVAI